MVYTRGLKNITTMPIREIVAAYEGYWNDTVSGGNGLETRNKEKGKIL